MEKFFWENFISSRDGLKKDRNKVGTLALQKVAGPLSGLQRNALISLVYFVTNTTK